MPMMHLIQRNAWIHHPPHHIKTSTLNIRLYVVRLGHVYRPRFILNKMMNVVICQPVRLRAFK
jgi:hypothetical protein